MDMNKIYTFAFLLFFSFSANAKTWLISVSDYQFNPATTNATVGDTIRFHWLNGTHTTTCGSALPGTMLPAGATEWDEYMDVTDTSFSYPITVAGDYLFGC